MRLIKYNFLLTFSFAYLFSQYKGDIIVREGVDAFFNYEYEKSIEILSTARINHANHPVVHAVWAAAWYQYDQSRFAMETVYSNFETRLDEIEHIYDSLILLNSKL